MYAPTCITDIRKGKKKPSQTKAEFGALTSVNSKVLAPVLPQLSAHESVHRHIIIITFSTFYVLGPCVDLLGQTYYRYIKHPCSNAQNSSTLYGTAAVRIGKEKLLHLFD